MKLAYLITLLSINFAFSQGPADIWYFGGNAGISFSSGNNPVAINDGKLNSREGCAVLSSNTGNLLFYTNGVQVWNKNHLVMPNGSGLLGDPSSTQSAIIVPKPNNPNQFYVFTVDLLSGPNGLNYSIIDLNADGGLGDIITKNVQLATPCLEKITVVKHANNVDFWVITHLFNSNRFVCYQITPTGVSSPIFSDVGITIDGSQQRTLGYMKSSPNGQFLACAHSDIQSAVQLFRFNNTTGQLSLISTSDMDNDYLGAYGLEFSSNSKLLYITNINLSNSEFKSQILQYNIESQNESTINASKTIVAEYTDDEFLHEGTFTALQLGPNQKIYVGRDKFHFLGAIEKPNIQGVGCIFTPKAVDLGEKVCLYGLPSFITSYLNLNFTSTDFCFGGNTLFELPEIENVTSVHWNFGDPTSSDDDSNDPNPSHVFTSPGTYTVTLTVQTATGPQSFSKPVQISTTPIANKPTDYKKCDEGNNQAIFTLDTKNPEVLGPTQNANDFTISYHLLLDDAENNRPPLPNTYPNTSNNQIIYVRIQPKNGNDCYATTSFKLVINELPDVEDDATTYYCTNKYPEKITLTAGTVTPAGTYTYKWSTGETSESIQVNQSGVYTVEIKNSNGCFSPRKITVLESNTATVTYNLLGSGGNYNLVVNATGLGNYTYSLDSNSGPYQTGNVFYNVPSGSHFVYVKDTNGCGITPAAFSVLGYPSFFTPNSDGINDTWGLDPAFTEYKSISIFDRYGKLIKFLTYNSPNWDGTFTGKKLPADDYWFTIVLNNGAVEKGHFTLKR
ncbi:T9SS type B sorting domain-containing protein [Flavobacterium sp.]|uniref:T9SS type B sorting domain-containing protein n=1 Tax=Flavobacterium sp. TaxID=239 RepID=UPI00260D726D|nr:T9SS type B sorting domain-containing protein [Flavobacterium sp.]